jgi:hypothetical protein
MSEPVQPTFPIVGISEVLLSGPFSADGLTASLTRSATVLRTRRANTTFVMDALALKAGLNTGASTEYPPAAMYGTTTALSGFGYGNGTYVATASSTFFDDASVAPHRAFDRATGAWLSGGADMAPRYEDPGPLVLREYIGSATTTVADVVHEGKWLQQQLLTAVFADELHFMLGDGVAFPGSIVVAGSNDGATWSLLSSHLDMPAVTLRGTEQRAQEKAAWLLKKAQKYKRALKEGLCRCILGKQTSRPRGLLSIQSHAPQSFNIIFSKLV